MPPRCLFAAPYKFIPEIVEIYQDIVPTDFLEVWHESDLPPNCDEYSVWVTHPGYSFTVTEVHLERFSNLEILVTASTGNTHIDDKALVERGIEFSSLLDDREALENIAASAEYTFLLTLNALKGRGLHFAMNEVIEGRWRKNEHEMRGFELQGKKVGLIGLGRIGRRMFTYCKAFGAEVRYYDPYVESKCVAQIDSLKTLFAESDVIVVSCSLTSETENMVDYELLRLMPANAAFVNSARGEIVDEHALAKIIEERPDIAVGLDVIAGENQDRQYQSPLIPFIRSDRITAVPHIAGATYESQKKAALIALGRIQEWMRMRTSE